VFRQLTSISGRLGPTVLLLVGSRYYNYPLIKNATSVKVEAVSIEAAVKLLTDSAPGTTLTPECCLWPHKAAAML